MPKGSGPHPPSYLRNVDAGRWMTIDCGLLDDARLTARALGMLVKILAQPADSDISLDWVRTHFKGEGAWATATAMKDLCYLGYMIRAPVRDSKGRIYHTMLASSLPIWSDVWTPGERLRGKPERELSGIDLELWMAAPGRALGAVERERRPKFGAGSVTQSQQGQQRNHPNFRVRGGKYPKKAEAGDE
jgi:hypothetical protein